MERKSTNFKLLLLIFAIFLGMNLHAQDGQPVKKAPAKTNNQIQSATSNYTPANWQLEQELFNALQDNTNVTGASVNLSQQADNNLTPQQQQAQKMAAIQAEESVMAQKMMQLQNPTHLADMAPLGNDEVTKPFVSNNTDALWDVLLQWTCNLTTAAQTAIETDGNFIYVGHWAIAGSFEKYDLSGNFISAFTIPAITAGGARDMAFDGTVMYVSSGTTTIYKVNFATLSVVGTITAPITTRHITYDPNLNAGAGGLWVGDWSTLRSISLTGTTLSTPAVTMNSVYGSCYDNYSSPGNNYLWFFSQATPAYPSATLVQFNIATQSYTGVTHNVIPDLTPAPPAGSIAGGLGSSAALIPGKFVMLGMLQTGTAPFKAFVYELGNTITYTNDVGVKALVAPLNDIGLGPAETITVTLQNYGSAPQSNFPVFYQLDGGAPVVDTYIGTILPGATDNFTFNITGDFSTYGNHTLYVCTNLSGDQQTANDCKTFTVVKIMPTWTDTIYPNLMPYWTGTTNGSSFTENSLMKIKSGNVEDAWAKFDITNIPDNAPISEFKYRHFVQTQNAAPYYRVNKLAIDPMTNTPAAVLSGIQSGTQYLQTTSNYTAGIYHTFTLPQQARTDLSAATLQNWFALGVYEYEASVGSYYATIQGWAETNKPHIVVTYGYVPGPNDVGVTAMSSPVSGSNLLSSEIVSIMIRNYGSVPQSNFPVSYQINGATPVVEIYPGTIAPGAQVPFTFVTNANMFPFGIYMVKVCTQLAGDNFVNNDCKTFFITNAIPTVTDTVYPMNLANWTGSTNGTAFTQTSLIKIASGNVENGWAKFDISAIPGGVTILDLNLYYNVQSQSGAPYFRMNQLLNDPMTGTPASVMSSLIGGTTYISTTSGYSVGWHNFALPAQAKVDFTNQTDPADWFGIGFYEYETCNNCYYGTINGWEQGATRPYIILTYELPIAHDIEVVSVNTDPFIVQGPYNPTATVRNKGLNTETFPVTITGPNGYTDTQTVTNLAPGASIIVNFATWNALPGTATLTVCSELANDLYNVNNCKSKTLAVEVKLTVAYGFVASAGSSGLPVGPCRFYLQHPEVMISLAPNQASQFISGGCWANGVWYGAEYSLTANSNLWTLNPNTGAMTLIGPMGANIAGLTYDHTTNIMYAISAFQGTLGEWRAKLYTVNMTSGAMTLIYDCGPIGLPINLACSQTGMLFFAEITNDRLWSYDPIDNQMELMGTLGANLNYAQDAEFDKEDNTLYFAGYATTGTLYKVNVATGALITVGTFLGGAEITGFAIPYTWTPEPVDLGAMWITYPTIGNLTSTEPVMVRVRNYGLTTVTDVTLSFTHNDSTRTEQWSTWGYPPIDPGVYFTYAFIPVIDLSTPGSHCIKTWISNVVPPLDTNQVNDTVTKCVSNASCGTITCFPNSIQETELCGDNTNGGCNSNPPAYVDLLNGEVRCGTTWKVDTMRDTDWYRFSLSSVKAINVHARAEFNCVFTIVKLPCTNQQVLFTKTFNKCQLDSFFVNALHPGEYAIMVAHDWLDFNTTCINNNKYTFDFAIVPARYCTATSSICDEYISNVQFGSIVNPTACTPGGYANYTALSTIIEVGQTYPITVTNGLLIYSADQCGIWIDWNQDYDFDDIGEKITPVNGSPGVGPYTASITVPANALPGTTRMRTRITYTGDVLPCGNTTWGEVEDYSVFVSAPVPPIITTAGSITDVCPGTKIVPISVEQFNGVNGINLVLGMGTGVTYVGFQNVNAGLSNSTINITPSGNTVQVNWFSVTPANIGTGVLFELILQTASGTNQLVWNTGPEGSQYTSLITGILPSNWVNGTLTFGNCSDLGGFVIYKNPTPRVIRDSTVVQLFSGTSLAYSFNIDNPTGAYLFTNLGLGNYTLTAAPSTVPNKLWGGGNATDALAILRHFVGMQLLTGLNKTVADVNGSGGLPNAADALAVSRRFVGQIPNFLPPSVPVPGGPDWYFETFPTTIDGTANQSKNIYALCAGDVNGSYIPLNTIVYVPSKPAPTVYMRTEGSISISNDIVDVPVYVEDAMLVGAVSLVIEYPANLDIVDVVFAHSNENMVYTAQNGTLRLAWFSLEPLDLNANGTLLTLKVRANSLNNKEMNFYASAESVLANDAAVNIETANLMIPKLVALTGQSVYNLNNYPNPFSQSTEIRYSMPVDGFVTVKVFNVLGDEVATLVNTAQKAGNHTVSFDGSTLPKGVYMYKLQVNDVTMAKTMVITE